MSKSKNKPNSFSLSGAQSPQVGKASACGKAIIVGEHGVVYGAHAVAMPLKQMGMKVEVRPHSPDNPSNTYHLKLGGKDVSDRIAGLIPDTFELLGQEFFPLTMDGHSNIPIGAGLGSSATLCVAALRSILESCGRTLTRDKIAQVSNEMEKRFHGNPSGLDTAVVAYEECIYFAKGKNISPIEIPKEDNRQWHFALVDSKIRASTMAMINIAQPYFLGSQGEKRLEAFDRIALVVSQALPAFNQDSVAEAMIECASLLKEAQVVPDSLHDMLLTCQSLGIPAAKTTGAGGGGTILCLLDQHQWAEQYSKIKSTFSEYPTFHIRL